MFNLLKKYKADVQHMCLEDVAKDHPFTKLDTTFQRKGGLENGSGWKPRNYSEYVYNLKDGSSFNFIVRADIEKCKEHAQKIGDDESYEYYTGLQQEVNYTKVSVDGYNSSSGIYHFCDETVREDEDRRIPWYNTDPDLKKGQKREKFFTELDSDTQKDILYRTPLMVVTLNAISRQEICALFRKLNKQTSLNAQEYRNAVLSDFSAQVREWANKHAKTFFEKIYHDITKRDKRVHEQLVATFSLMVQSNFGDSIGKKFLDKFYENKKDVDPNKQSVIKKVMQVSNDAMKAWEKQRIAKEKKHDKFKLSRGKILVWWHCIQIAIEEMKMNISNPYEFFKFILAEDAKMGTIAKKVPDKDKSKLSYTYWRDRRSTNSSSIKSIRQLLGMRLRFAEAELLDKTILSKKRQSSDSFPFSLQPTLWTLQDEKDRKDVHIDLLDVYAGDYSSDHVKSVFDGGESVISNAELMDNESNLIKNKNSNEPYFPHQTEKGEQLELPTAI